MKVTKLQVNAILVCLELVVIQIFALWIFAAHDVFDIQKTQLEPTEYLALMALVFSPTAGLVWCAKHFASRDENGKTDSSEGNSH